MDSSARTTSSGLNATPRSIPKETLENPPSSSAATEKPSFLADYSASSSTLHRRPFPLVNHGDIKEAKPLSSVDDQTEEQETASEGRSTNPNPLFEQSLRRLAGRFELTTSKAIATKKGCKCKKSTRCLKLYCSCFRVGALCNPALCNCVGCENKKECGIPSENRAFAVQDILLRRPDAFEPRQKRNSVVGGCSCTRTR